MKLYYVVSYPKSGATWFRFLMYSLFFQKLENSYEVQLFYPEVPGMVDIIEQNIKADKTFFIKSHFDYSDKLPFINDATAIIHIVRNPFNCMLSQFDHYKYEGIDWVSEKGGLNHFCNKFIERANLPAAGIQEKIHGGWNFHTQLWYNLELDIPIIYIKYEDLLQDTAGVLEKICKQLNFDFNKNQIENAVRLSDFQNVRKIEERELMNEQPGMFYSPERRKNFISDKTLRFVKLGKKRNTFANLDPDRILEGKLAFYEGMSLAKYR